MGENGNVPLQQNICPQIVIDWEVAFSARQKMRIFGHLSQMMLFWRACVTERTDGQIALWQDQEDRNSGMSLLLFWMKRDNPPSHVSSSIWQYSEALWDSAPGRNRRFFIC